MTVHSSNNAWGLLGLDGDRRSNGAWEEARERGELARARRFAYVGARGRVEEEESAGEGEDE